MKKSDINKKVAKHFGMTQAAASEITESLLNTIALEASDGGKVTFRDFGVFRARTDKPRTRRNPKTGEEFDAPESRYLVFKMGQGLFGTLNGGNLD